MLIKLKMGHVKVRIKLLKCTNEVNAKQYQGTLWKEER